MGRKSLAPQHAFILVPSTSVHMFFMRFPIDVAILDDALKVVAVYHSLAPWSVSGLHLSARYAVELPAGILKTTDTEVGDTLELPERTGG